MAIFLFADNARSTLGAALSLGGSQITLASGTGSLFPNPAPGQAFALTLNDQATQANFEVVWCTARAGDVLTVQRAQEGTAARSWLIGDFCWNGVTMGQMGNMVQTPHMTDASISPTFNVTGVTGNLTVLGNTSVGGVGSFSNSVTVTDPNTATVAGLNVRSTGANGAGLALFGNTGSNPTPNKYIRARDGVLEIINSNYQNIIFQMNDFGDISVVRGITATGSFNVAGPINSGGPLTGTDTGLAGLAINPGPTGANIILRGAPTTTSKFIRAINNRFEVVNAAYTAAIFSIDDAGNVIMPGATIGISGLLNVGASIAAGGQVTGATLSSLNGNVTANNGRLRASLGASNSGDPNAATLLADFPGGANANGSWQFGPNGFLLQWGTGVATDTGNNIFYGTAFATQNIAGAVAVIANAGFNGNTVQVFRWDPTGFAVWGNNLVNPLHPAQIGFSWIAMGF